MTCKNREMDNMGREVETQRIKRKCWRSSLVAQQVKDSALSLLWGGFEPWPWNFHMSQVWPKKKKKKKKKRTCQNKSSTTEIKDNIAVLINGLDKGEERIGELEQMSIKTSQAEVPRGQRIKETTGQVPRAVGQSKCATSVKQDTTRRRKREQSI